MDIPRCFELKDKVGILTGGAGVICSKVAKAMGECGAKLAILDISTDAMDKLSKELDDKNIEHITIKTDILNKKSIEKASSKILNRFGKVDILINGAGGNHPDATTKETQSFFDLKEEAIKFVFNLNFTGTFMASQVFGKIIAEQGEGVILNISSMNAFTPLTNIPAYSAAKAALSKILLDIVKKTADTLFIPFTVGGGFRKLEEIREVLASGADKISINTGAVRNPALVKESSEIFGQQCIVVAIDAKRSYISSRNHLEKKAIDTSKGKCWWEIYIEGGRIPTGIDAISWAKQVEELGAGEILLTSMDYDGTQQGYDLPLTRAISESTNIPIIASGGAGNPEHIFQAFSEGKADAALAASIFHRSIYPIKEVKKYLKDKGICVRLS